MIGNKPVQRNPVLSDESGQLSLDFMVGLSIFMIAFIIAATMTSGLLIGLESRDIDYDAVAYRTGVILAEDPGEIEETVGVYPAYAYIAPDRYAWDLIYTIDYWNQFHDSNIFRMGLMMPRYYYDVPPRVLMFNKIWGKFGFFEPENQYPLDYYKDKIIFSDYPYQFNISLTMLDGSPSPQPVGSPIPDTSTGYIRRVVLVKNSTRLIIKNTSSENASGVLTVTYNYRNISEGDPAYMIYPSLETTIIALNISEPDIFLHSLQVCSPTCEDPEQVSPTIWLKNYADPGYSEITGLGVGLPVNNSTYLEVEPGYFSRRYFPNLGPVDQLTIRMQFLYSNGTPPQNLGGSHDYYYRDLLPNIAEFENPPLAPAILEVRVW